MPPHCTALFVVIFGAYVTPSLAATPSSSADDDDDSNCLLQTISVTRRYETIAPSASEDDTTYLLQDPVAKIAKASAGDSGPSNMLHTVEAIIDRSQARGGRVTPEEVEMIQSVAQMIEDISLPALEVGRLQNQREVDRVGTSLATCEAMRTSAGTELGGVANRHALLESSRDAHRSCRALESELEAEKAAKCGNFADYAAGLVPPAGVFPNPAEPSEPMEAFLRSNQEWFNQKYEQYMLHKEQCNSATQLHAAKQEECVGEQTAFETSSCAMSGSVHRMCAPYTSCRNAAEVEQASTWDDVRAIEEQRKVEFVTLKKIKCLILSLAVEDEAAGTGRPGEASASATSVCMSADLGIRYDGSIFDPGQLNVTYPAVAPRFLCSENPSAHPLPCGFEFLNQEYVALPPNAPAAPCVPCTGLPAQAPALQYPAGLPAQAPALPAQALSS